MSDKDKELAKALSLGSLKTPKLSAAAKAPGTPPSPKAAVSTAVKTPKAAKPADPFGKPSLMIKNEDSVEPKHVSVRKLRDFLKNKKNKR